MIETFLVQVNLCRKLLFLHQLTHNTYDDRLFIELHVQYMKIPSSNLGPKNTNIAFFACFCPYVGQPHSHIGWDKSMPFASINPTNPRTDPWNFHKKILRIGDFEKCTFFESAILNFFFQKILFLLHSHENSQKFIG